MDCPGNQFFSRSRLAENQHGRIGGRDQFDALHHGPQARTGADDRIAQGFASQPRQQRPLVGLGRLAQRRHLAQAKVIVQCHGQRLEKQLAQTNVLGSEGLAGRCQE